MFNDAYLWSGHSWPPATIMAICAACQLWTQHCKSVPYYLLCLFNIANFTTLSGVQCTMVHALHSQIRGHTIPVL